MSKHHSNCSHKGCFIEGEQCQILAGCLFGSTHELVCFFLLNYEYTGTFFDNLVCVSGINTQDIAFALSDLKQVGIVTQEGTNTFNSLWRISKTVDVTHLCSSTALCVIELYKRLGNRKKGARSGQKRRVNTRLSKIRNRGNRMMKRR